MILDADLVWRRREISSLITLTKLNSNHVQVALVRAAIPMLYAHWEGFGRECIVRYLEFVSNRRLKFKLLDPAFLYLASIPSLSMIGNVGVKQALDIIQTFMERSEATNKDNFRKVISAKSNLRADILKDLLISCGLDSNWVTDHEDFINRELCDPRNEIAHGNNVAPSLDAFMRRRDRTFELMSHLQVIVVNSAVNGRFHNTRRAA
jgi:hypothetical protein